MSLDEQLSTWIYENIGLNSNPMISNLPYYLGLLPYEIYVIPGMFLAIFVMLFNETAAPLQFHLLPHWFAYSMSIYLKNSIDRVRPGCKGKEQGKRIDPKHCETEPKLQSFPSGHTVIAFALLMALFLFLFDPTYNASGEKWIFAEGWPRFIILVVGFVISFNVGLHRIAFGYHHVGDVLLGMFLGIVIGFISYFMCNKLRGEMWPLNSSSSSSSSVSSTSVMDWKEYFMTGMKSSATSSSSSMLDGNVDVFWTGSRIAGCILSLLGIGHFFTKSFSKLSELKH